MRLDNCTAIVTGAGSGIGEATAIRFAQEGAKVVVVDIDRAAGEKTLSSIKKNGGEGVAVDADVSKENDAKQMADTAVKASWPTTTGSTLRRFTVTLRTATSLRLGVTHGLFGPMLESDLSGRWRGSESGSNKRRKLVLTPARRKNLVLHFPRA